MADLPIVDVPVARASADTALRASAFAKATADRPVTNLDARPTQTPEQVRALAVQFESILLAQMLKDMRDSMFDSGE
jgi:Rod binding domain-containing protein